MRPAQSLEAPNGIDPGVDRPVARRVGRPRRDARVPPVDTREAILIAAARLFSRHGYHGVRLNEVAKAAGLSSPAVYYYFSDKTEILRALGVFSLGRTIEVTQALVDRKVNPGAALFLVLWFHASRSMLNPYDMWYEVQFAGGNDGEFTEEYARWRSLLRRILSDGVAQGEFREVSESVALNLTVGSIYGIKELQRTERVKDPEALAEFVVRGLARSELQAAAICREARGQMNEWRDLIVGPA
jgi:AcrR family transcriptional regulator